MLTWSHSFRTLTPLFFIWLLKAPFSAPKLLDFWQTSHRKHQLTLKRLLRFRNMAKMWRTIRFTSSWIGQRNTLRLMGFSAYCKIYTTLFICLVLSYIVLYMFGYIMFVFMFRFCIYLYIYYAHIIIYIHVICVYYTFLVLSCSWFAVIKSWFADDKIRWSM
jgi:hypothetical protein